MPVCVSRGCETLVARLLQVRSTRRSCPVRFKRVHPSTGLHYGPCPVSLRAARVLQQSGNGIGSETKQRNETAKRKYEAKARSKSANERTKRSREKKTFETKTQVSTPTQLRPLGADLSQRVTARSRAARFSIAVTPKCLYSASAAGARWLRSTHVSASVPTGPPSAPRARRRERSRTTGAKTRTTPDCYSSRRRRTVAK